MNAAIIHTGYERSKSRSRSWSGSRSRSWSVSWSRSRSGSVSRSMSGSWSNSLVRSNCSSDDFVLSVFSALNNLERAGL